MRDAGGRVPAGVVFPPMSPEPTAPGAPGTPVSASDRSGPGPTVPWTRLAAFAAAYFAAAMLTHVLSHGSGRIGRLWLPGGVFLGVLLLTEMRTWPRWIAAAAVGSLGFDLVVDHHRTLTAIAVIFIGNTATAVIGAWGLRRFVVERPALSSLRELAGWVVLPGLVAIPFSATLGSLAVDDYNSPSFVATWITWFMSQALGSLLVATALVAWRDAFHLPLRWIRPRRIWEPLLLTLGLVVSVALVARHARTGDFVPRYVVLPFIIWSAVSFGTRGVTLVSLGMTLTAGAFSALGYGSVVQEHLAPLAQAVELETALIILALFGLVPAIVISKLRQTEADLRESERRLQLVLRGTNDGWWDWDVIENRIFYSPRWWSMLGYEADIPPADANAWRRLTHPDDLPRVEAELAAAFRTRQSTLEVEFRLRHRLGHAVPVLARAHIVRDAAGRALRMSGCNMDLTERKRAESAERLARATIDRATLAVFWTHTDGHFADVNDFAASTLGYTREELLQLHIGEVDTHATPERWPRYRDELREAGTLTFVTRLRRRDQRLFEAEIHAHHLALADREVIFFFARDITEKVTAERELRDQTRFVETVLENAPNGFAVFHPGTGQSRYVSARFEEIYGVPRGSFHTVDDFFRLVFRDPTERARTREAIMAGLGSGHADRMRWDAIPLELPSGARRFITSINIPLRDQKLIVSTVQDVTARVQLEEQLRQSQKMEVVGQLAGGVAHDFNNILLGIMLNVELLKIDSAGAGDSSLPVNQIESLARRAARLTEQLLMFARRQAIRTRTFDVNLSLDQLLQMLHRLLGEHVTVKWVRLDPHLWVEADSTLIDQAVTNLCVNARDAMPQGGVLTLETQRVRIDEEEARRHAGARPGGFVCIRISDTGSGMPPEVLAHIFEPFFTTKDVGKGTGLGLASVHGIIHQHRGWITVESTVGVGSTFRIYLPEASPASPEPAAPVARPERRGGTETILLVEDEDVVRSLNLRVLKRLGYTVVPAVNGHDALRVWREYPGEFDLLFTDVAMPGGMTGVELAERLRALKPGLKVLLTSGYSTDLNPEEAAARSRYAFLAKPYELNRLTETLRQCLDQPGP
jgi:two-component system cell cycle sensor histidine kinase/response regulator CckA